jgi:hypothetical protein
VKLNELLDNTTKSFQSELITLQAIWEVIRIATRCPYPEPSPFLVIYWKKKIQEMKKNGGNLGTLWKELKKSIKNKTTGLELETWINEFSFQKLVNKTGESFPDLLFKKGIFTLEDMALLTPQDFEIMGFEDTKDSKPIFRLKNGVHLLDTYRPKMKSI